MNRLDCNVRDSYAMGKFYQPKPKVKDVNNWQMHTIKHLPIDAKRCTIDLTRYTNNNI